MAPKRKNTKKEGASYDSSHYVNAEAYERYDKALNVVVRNCISEWGIDFGDYNVPGIIGIIQNRRWGDFCKEPLAAVDFVVREFYINACDHKDGKTMVQGKAVKFDPSTINRFYGLTNVNSSDYTTLQGNADYQNVITFLTREGIGAQWKMHNGEYRMFPSKHQSHITRVWHYFVLARMMPSTHVSDVSKERALLLFAILQNMPLNFGSIIYSFILHCMKIVNVGFSFPSLITDLYASSGVQYASREKLIQPKPVLNPHFFNSLTSGNVEAQRQEAPPSSSTSQRMTIEDRMERLKEQVLSITHNVYDQWAFMRQQQTWFEQQALCHSAYLDYIGQMSRMHLSSSGVDLRQFLEFPTYLGSNFAYSSGVLNEGKNGGSEDMDD